VVVEVQLVLLTEHHLFLAAAAALVVAELILGIRRAQGVSAVYITLTPTLGAAAEAQLVVAQVARGRNFPVAPAKAEEAVVEALQLMPVLGVLGVLEAEAVVVVAAHATALTLAQAA
jgi:hypothetical protein